MKQINITQLNEYTCQRTGCNNIIKGCEDIVIIQNVFPVCSDLCKFLVIFKILWSYDDLSINYLIKLLHLKQRGYYNREKRVFELSKKVYQILLSSVNDVTHTHTHKILSMSKGYFQRVTHYSYSLISIDMSVSNTLSNPILSKSKGGLEKWM